jgi:hypothetical protein
MYWKNVGYLLKEITTLDELKRPKIAYEEIKIFCNIKSIGQSEFYQSSVAGLRPEVKVEIKLINLSEDITHFKYNGKIYKILRTYEKEDITELTLTSMVVNNG